MSKEQPQNAQTVTEKNPENSVTKNPVEVKFPKPPVLQVDLAKLNPEMLKTAESLGIPLGAIINYVGELQEYNQSVEARLEAIVANFEPAVKDTVMKMVKDAQTAPAPPVNTAMQPTQQTQAAPMNPLTAIMSMVMQNPQLIQTLMGQVNSNPMQEKFNTFLSAKLDQAINELVTPPPNPFEDLGREMVKSITAKTASKVVGEMIP